MNDLNKLEELTEIAFCTSVEINGHNAVYQSIPDYVCNLKDMGVIDELPEGFEAWQTVVGVRIYYRTNGGFFYYIDETVPQVLAQIDMDEVCIACGKSAMNDSAGFTK